MWYLMVSTLLQHLCVKSASNSKLLCVKSASEKISKLNIWKFKNNFRIFANGTQIKTV